MDKIMGQFFHTLSSIKEEYFGNKWIVREDGIVVDGNGKNKETYRVDPVDTVRLKCFAIATFNPVKTCALALVHMIKLAYVVAGVVFDLLWNFAKQFMDDKTDFKMGLFIEFFEVLVNELLDTVRDIFICLGIQLGAMYGVYHPFNGRKIVGKLEKALNDDIVSDGIGSYMALCFQSRQIL
ncbi:MAG: hypothetical protein P4L16_01090 [Chlamydiales bacterium]|nr:hypothetical protein [Chlamydiales bacterium]